MAQKRGLGRGLASLIPTEPQQDINSETTGTSSGKLTKKNNSNGEVKEVVKEVIKEVEKTLKITELEPNSNQPRKFFEEDPLQELSDSIKEFGIIQPIVVTPKNG